MPLIDVFAAPRTNPYFLSAVREQFAVHDDPATAPMDRIRAIVGSGESLVSAELVASLPALEIVSLMGVGYNGVDLDAVRARGVPVTYTPDLPNDDVADLAIGLMLCAARQLPQADRFVRERRWEQGPWALTRKMSGARLGVVGMGRIGQAIARRAQAFDMDIAYTARTAKADIPYKYIADLRELARHSDFLVVITPGGAGTHHLIDARVLEALGGKGILVNVARGSVVDEPALIDALERGVIAGAALDVFEDEPRVPERLRNLPRVVLTPHVGTATAETRKAMIDLALANLFARLEGRPVLTAIPECR